MQTAVKRSGPDRCLLCGCAEVHPTRALRSPYLDASYELYVCETCDSQFFDVHEHEVSLAQLYERQAESEEYRIEPRFKWSRYWHHEVKQLMALHGGNIRSVLDIGCRTGDFLMHWPARVTRVGVESSKRAADIAAQRGLTVVRAPVEEYHPPEPFSIVSLYAIVEHLVDPVAFLKRLPPLVERGGIVAIMIPTRQCLKQWLLTSVGRQWYMYAPPLHLTFISRRRLDEIMEGIGFERVRRRYTSGGTFNLFGALPVLSKVWNRLMWWADAYTLLNRLPVFDHMYTYYRKR